MRTAWMYSILALGVPVQVADPRCVIGSSQTPSQVPAKGGARCQRCSTSVNGPSCGSKKNTGIGREGGG